MTTYIALFNLTDAGIKAAKDSPRRLDAAKKLLADMGRLDEAVLPGDGRVRLCRNLRGAGRRRHGPLRPAARGPRLRAHKDAEGVPGHRVPRNHPLARLSRVGYWWRCAGPRELQRSHLAARRIENERPKISCASRPAAQFGGVEREASSASCRRCRNRADPSEYAWLGCAIGHGLAAAHPDSLSSRPACPACRQAACKSLDKNQPQRLSYGRAGGFPKVIEATARFMRPAGHAAARWGFPSLKSIVPWPCFKVTVPFLPVTVTSPLSTMTP
jgi:hypothetical protein